MGNRIGISPIRARGTGSLNARIDWTRGKSSWRFCESTYSQAMATAYRSALENQMSAQFWDTVASRFDDEIFNTLSNDRSRTILRHIDRFSSTDSTVCDFGCGVGRYLPLLAERFKAVCAVDISRKCL